MKSAPRSRRGADTLMRSSAASPRRLFACGGNDEAREEAVSATGNPTMAGATAKGVGRTPPAVFVKGRLLSAEDKYNRGDKTEIMKELAWHLTTHENEPLPEWLRLALLKAIIRATVCDIDSWDEVF